MARKARNGKYAEYEKQVLKYLYDAFNKIKQSQIPDLMNYEYDRHVGILELHLNLDIPRSSLQDVIKTLTGDELITQVTPSKKN